MLEVHYTFVVCREAQEFSGPELIADGLKGRGASVPKACMTIHTEVTISI